MVHDLNFFIFFALLEITWNNITPPWSMFPFKGRPDNVGGGSGYPLLQLALKSEQQLNEHKRYQYHP